MTYTYLLRHVDYVDCYPTCYTIYRNGREVEVHRLVKLLNELTTACEAAVEWRGMDGDSIHQPVLGQLREALKP